MDSMLLGQPCVFLNCFTFGKTNLWKYIWHKPDQEKSAAKQLAALSSQAGVHPSHDFKPFWKIMEESKQSYVGSTSVLCDHMYFRPSFLEGLSAKVVYISQVPLLWFQKWMFPNFWWPGNQKLNGHTQAIGLLKNLEKAITGSDGYNYIMSTLRLLKNLEKAINDHGARAGVTKGLERQYRPCQSIFYPDDLQYSTIIFRNNETQCNKVVASPLNVHYTIFYYIAITLMFISWGSLYCSVEHSEVTLGQCKSISGEIGLIWAHCCFQPSPSNTKLWPRNSTLAIFTQEVVHYFGL